MTILQIIGLVAGLAAVLVHLALIGFPRDGSGGASIRTPRRPSMRGRAGSVRAQVDRVIEAISAHGGQGDQTQKRVIVCLALISLVALLVTCVGVALDHPGSLPTPGATIDTSEIESSLRRIADAQEAVVVAEERSGNLWWRPAWLLRPLVLIAVIGVFIGVVSSFFGLFNWLNNLGSKSESHRSTAKMVGSGIAIAGISVLPLSISLIDSIHISPHYEFLIHKSVNNSSFQNSDAENANVDVVVGPDNVQTICERSIRFGQFGAGLYNVMDAAQPGELHSEAQLRDWIRSTRPSGVLLIGSTDPIRYRGRVGSNAALAAARAQYVANIMRSEDDAPRVMILNEGMPIARVITDDRQAPRREVIICPIR